MTIKAQSIEPLNFNLYEKYQIGQSLEAKVYIYSKLKLVDIEDIEESFVKSSGTIHHCETILNGALYDAHFIVSFSKGYCF